MHITFDPYNPIEVIDVRRILATITEVSVDKPEVEEIPEVPEEPAAAQLPPVVIPPSRHQQLHLQIASYLRYRSGPFTVNQIAEWLGLDSDTTDPAANSLQYLKSRKLVELPEGEYTRGWAATDLLRTRGVTAG